MKVLVIKPKIKEYTTDSIVVIQNSIVFTDITTQLVIIKQTNEVISISN